MKRCVWVCQKSVVCSGVTWCHRERECVRLLWIVNKEEKKSSDVQKSTSHHVARTHTHTRKEGKGEKTNHHLIHNAALFCSHWLHRFTHCCCPKCSEEGVTQAFTHGLRSCWLFSFFCFFSFFWNHDRGQGQSVAAAPTMPTAVSVSRWGLAVFGPPAEDLVRAVVATATRHARRGLVNLKSIFCGGRRRGKKTS